jgi:hypothetical protein
VPTTLDPTVGGATSNVYVDVATADTYFDNRVNSGSWNNVVDSDDKARALIMATDRLDQERYIGARASSTQRLQWPRAGTAREDGSVIPSTIIPREVVNATLELALEILRAGTTDIFAPTGLETFKSLRAGDVDIQMRDPLQPELYNDPAATAPALQRSQLPPQVQRWLRHLLISDIPAISLLRTGFAKVSRS